MPVPVNLRVEPTPLQLAPLRKHLTTAKPSSALPLQTGLSLPGHDCGTHAEDLSTQPLSRGATYYSSELSSDEESVATPGNNVALGFSFRPSQQRLSFTSTEQKPLEPSHLKGPQKRPLLLGRSLADLVAIKRPFPKARYSIRSEIKSIDEISIAEGLEVHSPCDELAASSDFDLADEALQKPRPAQVADSPPRLLPKDLSNDPSPIETSDGDDVILPVLPLKPVLDEKQWSQDSNIPFPTADEPTAAAHKLEEPAREIPKAHNVWTMVRDHLTATYMPYIPPTLVLPSAPTDKEKACYLRTNRLSLYAVGGFSFLALSAGMWLFVLTGPAFYWFGAIVGFLELYLVISYGLSMLGKDFDFVQHKQILDENLLLPENAPTVDVYLPCCKEPNEVLENTYKYVQALDYFPGKLQVHVLDDGGLASVEALAQQYGFNYISRDDKPRLKKAGNLRYAFARTSGDYFAIFDADFCPRADFLLETIPVHLAKPDTAILQTPQFFRTTKSQTWVEQGAGAIQELFYRVIQVDRNRWGGSICVGSNALYRRSALADVGGTAEVANSEDVYTGFHAVVHGWKVRYLPLNLACGICPDTPRSFFSQQMRWCNGSTTLLTNREFWISPLSFIQKLCFLSGMMYYSATALCIFVNPMPAILLLWMQPEWVKWFNLSFAIPSLLYTMIGLRLWARSSWNFNVQYIMVLQSYPYLQALADRIFNTQAPWVPSGDTKAHKNHKYRNMRILAWAWLITYETVLIAAVAYRVATSVRFYNVVPIIVLDLINVFFAHRFLFFHSDL